MLITTSEIGIIDDRDDTIEFLHLSTGHCDSTNRSEDLIRIKVPSDIAGKEVEFEVYADELIPE